MIITVEHKFLALHSPKTQSLWVPEQGDFWGCCCTSCRNRESVAWVLDLADILAIDPNFEKMNFHRDTVAAVRNSQYFGFAAFWNHRTEENMIDFVWYPRIDQVVRILEKRYFASHSEIPNLNAKYCLTLLASWCINESSLSEDASLEAMALEMCEHILMTEEDDDYKARHISGICGNGESHC